MNDFQKIEIKRAHAKPWRLPAWSNLFTALVAILLMLTMSAWTVYRSEKALNANVASKLETILQIESEAVRQWLQSERQLVVDLADDTQLADYLAAKTGATDPMTTDQGLVESRLTELSRRLNDKSFLLMSIDGQVVAGSEDRWLESSIESLEVQFCESLVAATNSVSSIVRPSSIAETEAEFGFVVAAPIRHDDSGVVGFLGVGIEAADHLTQVLKSSRSGKSGEVLAVASNGDLISQSRFKDGSSRLDFFPEIHRDSILNGRSAKRLGLHGEPDQRGVSTVFAARWMPQLKIGLVAKMDRKEANAPVALVRSFVWTLFSLLVLTTVSTVFYRWYIYRLRMRARQADLDRKILGAYELDGKLGEGGMGVVYRAKHALMRRPTAIKILPPEKSSQASIEGFEREVQYTSQLKHPNTIAIYDYGRSDNGLFYYAMELLDGVNLEQLVKRQGRLDDGRVIKILKQVSESLREAHSLGLIHRDIKPANIMLCNQGGAVDTVKVLDFGMVRDRAADLAQRKDALSGSPSYMAPECFTNPFEIDSRVDIFAVGAVGFFLLTGRQLLDAKALHELLQLHKTDIAANARQRMQFTASGDGGSISRRLIELIADCVESNRLSRPETIEDFLLRLSSIHPKSEWDPDQASRWWKTARHANYELETEQSDIRSATFALEATLPFISRQSLNANESNPKLMEEASAMPMEN